MNYCGLAVILALLLTSNGLAIAEQPKVYHVALVSLGSSELVIPQLRGLYHGLEEAGYTEGKNLVFHHIQGPSENQARTTLKEISHRRIDAIVATSAMETAIAKEITSTIPIVFAPARDPIRMGFVRSLARPGTNLTGLSFSRDVEDSAKQLAVFKQMAPAMRRIITLYAARQTDIATLEAVKRVATRLHIRLTAIGIESFAEAEQAVRAAEKPNIDGVFLVCNALFRGLKRIADIATPKGIPVFGCTASQVADEGALMTYTPDIYFLGYRGAWYVDRILKGAKPQDLPVEVPSKFEMVINLKISRVLGLKISPEMLILADKVFQ